MDDRLAIQLSKCSFHLLESLREVDIAYCALIEGHEAVARNSMRIIDTLLDHAKRHIENIP